MSEGICICCPISEMVREDMRYMIMCGVLRGDTHHGVSL